MTVSELKNICDVVEREYGSDSNVIIQIRDDDGSLIGGGYLLSVFRDDCGNLFLTNYNKQTLEQRRMRSEI